MDLTDAAVSKLLCPACWDLLDTFGAKFTVLRGHHATISTVDLPHWLPEENLRMMVQKYRDHVRKEIMFELHPTEHKGRNRSGTLESESAVSVGSDDSGRNVLVTVRTVESNTRTNAL
jgi:hypothetical protein